MTLKSKLDLFFFPKSIVKEGLREGDLEDLVLPLISVDEYDAKIADDAIVVGWFVKDDAPAYDLMRFIEQSATDLVDTEISPAPNQKGFFLVFAEFDRNEKFVEDLMNITGTLEGLTGISKWSMKAYKNDKIIDFNKNNINRYVRLKKKEKQKEAVENWLQSSLIEGYSLKENELVLRKANYQDGFELIAIGDVDGITQEYKLADFEFDELHESKAGVVQYYLGENYTVVPVNKKILAISKENQKAALLDF